MNKILFILKSEAFVFFIASLIAYSLTGSGWWFFLIFLLVPDLFMVGYVKDSKLGALIYNIGHSYITPFILLGIFLLFHSLVLLPISIIWIAHISMDRMLGFGLKLDTNFKDTHLGVIGKK